MKNIATKDEMAALLHITVKRFNESIDRIDLLCAAPDGLDYWVDQFRVAHEQAISHRLAYYLECSLRDAGIIDDEGPVVVDCEYNQHLFDRKNIRVPKKRAAPFVAAKRVPRAVQGRDDLFGFEIRPDILVHRRGYDRPTNLLALEVKRWNNPDRKHDELKLELLTEHELNTFQYVLAAAVYARNDLKGEERALEVGLQFHNGLPC